MGALAIIVFLVAGNGIPRRGLAQPSATPPQAMLAEAARLSNEVDRLYDAGKFQEAIPLAEQSLKLREKALGAIHPDVAQSLNNLGLVYDVLGAYARAEPLLIRALAIPLLTGHFWSLAAGFQEVAQRAAIL